MALTAEQQALDFNPELQDVSRQRKLAELLMSQGMQQPQGQMISGHYVAPSFAQQLNPIANILAGQAVGSRADTEQAKMAETLRTVGQQEVQSILQAAQTDPKAALALASSAKTPQGRALAQSLMASVLPKKTDKLVEYDTYKAEGGKKAFSDWAREITPEQQAKLDIDRQRLGLEGARLGLEKEKLALEMGGAKLTESQGNATAFGMRAKESNALLNQLEQTGTKNTGLIRSAVGATLGMTPFIGEKLEQNANTALNFTASPQQQATDQARRNFVTAVLRKESGAAISPSEFENEAKKYFPQPNDDASVIRQKQHARETAIKALEIQAGPGANVIRQAPIPKLDIGGAKKVVNFNDLP
jgi:hypothetical protein